MDFAVSYCRGGLRLPVHNAAATLLRKAKLVSQVAKTDAFRPTTADDAVHELLFPLGKVLTQLIERMHCPDGMSIDEWREATSTCEREKKDAFARRHSQGDFADDRDVDAARGRSEAEGAATPSRACHPNELPSSPPPYSGPLSIFTTPGGWASLWTPQAQNEAHDAPGSHTHGRFHGSTAGATHLARLISGEPREPQWKERLKLLDQALRSIRHSEQRLVQAITKGGASFGEAQSALAAVCSQHQALLRLAHSAFVESASFTRLLESMGHYDDNVQARVKPEELRPIQQRLIDSADAIMSELRSSQSEQELARQMISAHSPPRTFHESGEASPGMQPARSPSPPKKRPSMSRISMNGTMAMRRTKRSSKERPSRESIAVQQRV